MVVGVFPIAKLGTLLIKQISKPLANFAKERAKHNHFFRTYICMPPAQFYNWCEVKAKMWVMNLGKPVNVPVLSEAMAIELGANLLGESIIFVIAAGILFGEYARSSRKEAAKEEARKEEIEILQYTIQELYFQAERQDAQLRELMRTVTDLESQVVTIPWKFRSKDPPVDPKSPPPSPGIPRPSASLQGSPGIPRPSASLQGLGEQNTRISPDVMTEPGNGVIMQALAYLQMNDLLGRTREYHSSSVPIS